MASTGIKGFFRQKKGGIAKKHSGHKKFPEKIGISATTPEPAQFPSLVTHGKFDLRDEDEEKLMQFDMDMTYGPCLGLTRLERWERATSMGLNPPPAIRHLLLNFSGSNPALECLWDGRV